MGNAITWSPIDGGSGVTSVYEVFVCAKRPGDSAFHIVGTSLPNTFDSENQGGIVSTRFVDFGWNDPMLPWYVSDADCNAMTPTPSLFTTRVDGGGGTMALHIADALPRRVELNALVRFNNAPALNAADLLAGCRHQAAPDPVHWAGRQYVINSAVATPWKVTIWQQGDLASMGAFDCGFGCHLDWNAGQEATSRCFLVSSNRAPRSSTGNALPLRRRQLTRGQPGGRRGYR